MTGVQTCALPICSAEKPYWKSKGGNTYHVTDIPCPADYQVIVDAAGVEVNNEMFHEYIIDWSIAEDDYMSQFEQDQLEYEGRIIYPDPRIEYSELLKD